MPKPNIHTSFNISKSHLAAFGVRIFIRYPLKAQRATRAYQSERFVKAFDGSMGDYTGKGMGSAS